MSQRVAKPADIKTLKNWVDRWPKAGNLLFDEATREPTINASDGTKVGSIPWKREGDIITVLTQPTKFTQNIVELAKKRITSINVAAKTVQAGQEAQMRVLEGALLKAWADYKSAPSIPLLQAVLSAEKALASQSQSTRVVITNGDFMSTYLPPVPMQQRALPI